ncbi:hypothetical protein MKEN_00519000 [Mycena kentingensis (nom. inval.)]|nr:hypothetical protein MKEN_00519000 [Mycena kentingensis (nom. inval.)]
MSQLQPAVALTPQARPLQARLFFFLDGRWKPIIQIDHAKARSFCRFPRRWFLYVATRIWAPGCDGVLMANPGGDHLDIDSPNVVHDYYFVCTTSHALRFPDVSAFKERTPTSTPSLSLSFSSNSRELSLRNDVIRRDSIGIFDNVVLPADLSAYAACHIIPHTKTSMVCMRGIPAACRVQEIDSVNNALFLSNNMRTVWSGGRIGFLPVPNAILQPMHFDLPTTYHPPLSPEPSHMLICHHLVSPIARPVIMEAPNNAPGRYVQGDDAAALYLLEEAYVINVLNAFGFEANYPTANIDLVPLAPERVEADEIEAQLKNYSPEQDDAGEEESDNRQLSNWEKLCILGARTDPSIRQWRRTVPTISSLK